MSRRSILGRVVDAALRPSTPPVQDVEIAAHLTVHGQLPSDAERAAFRAESDQRRARARRGGRR